MNNISKEQIVQAINKFQDEHPLPFPNIKYDVTTLPNKESVNVISATIDRIMIEVNKNTEMYLVCEMAKAYMAGVVPHYEDRPTGKWKEWTDERFGGVTIYCSVCKKKALKNIKSNYCPNCGARMEAENE